MQSLSAMHLGMHLGIGSLPRAVGPNGMLEEQFRFKRQSFQCLVGSPGGNPNSQDRVTFCAREDSSHGFDQIRNSKSETPNKLEIRNPKQMVHK